MIREAKAEKRRKGEKLEHKFITRNFSNVNFRNKTSGGGLVRTGTMMEMTKTVIKTIIMLRREVARRD